MNLLKRLFKFLFRGKLQRKIWTIAIIIGVIHLFSLAGIDLGGLVLPMIPIAILMIVIFNAKKWIKETFRTLKH